MSKQKQHILLGYFKTLRFGPARILTPDVPLGRLALIELS